MSLALPAYSACHVVGAQNPRGGVAGDMGHLIAWPFWSQCPALGQREAGEEDQAAWGQRFSNPVVLLFLMLAPEKPGVTG